MKKEQIITKAIEKATRDGWKISFDMKPVNDHPIGMASLIIFKHDFAKAFFGKFKVCEFCGDGIPFNRGIGYSECCTEWTHHRGIESWKYNLQKMVLEVEPIKYLERFM